MAKNKNIEESIEEVKVEEEKKEEPVVKQESKRLFSSKEKGARIS